MRDSVTIGRVAGITVGINWSWLIVFALIAWTLATGIFPETNPGLADGAYIAMALVAAVLFFTSLLLHEFGHAFQARREGMEIEGITLWLFGGVAKFSGMFPSAAAEFRIAIAGPLVSLLLGVGFLLFPALLPFAAYVDGVLFWRLDQPGPAGLQPPAGVPPRRRPCPAVAPLEGEGRLPRGDAPRGRDRPRVRLPLRRGRRPVPDPAQPGQRIWMAFMGWFLLRRRPPRSLEAAAQQALGGLLVRDVMTRDPATSPASLTLGQFLDDVMWSEPYTTYPVTENSDAVGLLPFRRVAAVPRSEWDTRTVGEHDPAR